MILDHNTSVGVQWYTENDNSKAAVTALTKMNGILTDGVFTTEGDTSGWNGVPSRTDSYIAIWYNGSSNMTSTIDYTGYKARLITAQEVANIVGKENWNENTAKYDKAWFYFGSLNQTDYSSQNVDQKARQESYAWMFDNLYSSVNNGGTTIHIINGDFGYWTSSPTTGISYNAWSVYSGSLNRNSTGNTDSGVRPVITISEL